MAFNDNSLIADILRLIGIKNLSPQSQISRPLYQQNTYLNKIQTYLFLELMLKTIF